MKVFRTHDARRVAAGLPAASGSTAGVTVVEMLIVMAILLVAVRAFAETITAAARQRRLNHEALVAAEGARFVLESMREVSLANVFALYNSDPADDPAGAGTAPGHRFTVEGLRPMPDEPDGQVGEIFFPAVEVGGVLELREDFVDRSMGMPRDLDGDSIIDGTDHSGDYFRLPVSVRLRWMSVVGERTMRIDSMLCLYRYQ